LAAARIGTNANPVLPVDGGSIEVWQLISTKNAGLNVGSWEIHQRHAEGRPLFDLGGIASRVGSDYASACASKPMFGAETVLEHRQQTGQVAGVASRNEYEG
jgi:hypothetical protein